MEKMNHFTENHCDLYNKWACWYATFTMLMWSMLSFVQLSLVNYWVSLPLLSGLLCMFANVLAIVGLHGGIAMVLAKKLVRQQLVSSKDSSV